MAGSNDFTGQNIQDTYQRVLQISGSGEITNGTGSIVKLVAVIVPLELILPDAVIWFTLIFGIPVKLSANCACDDDNSNVISWDADTAWDAVTFKNGTCDPVPSANSPLDDICKTLW